MFGYPMEPFAQMLADTPKDFKKQTSDIIPDDAAAFKDNAWNHNSTRAGSLMTFVSAGNRGDPWPSLGDGPLGEDLR